MTNETNETFQKIIELQSELKEIRNEIIRLREEILRELQQSNRYSIGVNTAMLGFSIMIFASGLYYQKYGVGMTDAVFVIVYLILMSLAIYAIMLARRVVKNENNQG